MSVCFTQRHTLLSLPQERSTLTIPITPRPPETAVFITEPLLCAANKVSPLLDWTQRAGEKQERERGVEWMKSLGCLQWWCLYSQPPPPPTPPPYSELSLHVGAEGQCLLGEGLQRDQDLTQGNSKSHKGGVGGVGFQPLTAALYLFIFLTWEMQHIPQGAGWL